MRQKRVKSYRKVMQLYCSTFKFREPYQLLVDAAFLQSCVQQKLDFEARVHDVLQGAVKPMITQCCIQALYDAGKEGQAAVDLAKEFERRKCNHFKPKPEDECMATMAGKDNPNRYVIATQSLALRKSLRAVPGLPLVYINRSVMLLESPSDQTMQKKSRMENEKLHVPAAELALLNKSPLDTTALDSNMIIGGSGTSPIASTSAAVDSSAAPPTKKKRKGPKGPNPLSVKKKAKPAAGGGGGGASSSSKGASKKRERSEDGVATSEGAAALNSEEKYQRKRKRAAEEEVRVVSSAGRGPTGSERDGDKAGRKKRKRGKRGGGGGGDVADGGTASGAAQA